MYNYSFNIFLKSERIFFWRLNKRMKHYTYWKDVVCYVECRLRRQPGNHKTAEDVGGAIYASGLDCLCIGVVHPIRRGDSVRALPLVVFRTGYVFLCRALSSKWLNGPGNRGYIHTSRGETVMPLEGILLLLQMYNTD